MRIAEGTNEILLRGPNVILGYLNMPEKTAEAIDADGWLHTGDVGHVDNDGYFYITDRMKDIIITAGGKNITPSELENDLKFSPYITDAVVVGDKRAYLVALVMIDQENVEKFAQDHDIPFSNYASLTQSKEVQDLIQGEVDRVNKCRGRRTHADDEAQTQVGREEVRRADRRDVPLKPNSITPLGARR
jgi:long-chain acyl-CoA synthetase